MSWGGAGISRGKGNWSVDGRVRGRRCRDRAAMVGVAPRKAWTFDAANCVRILWLFVTFDTDGEVRMIGLTTYEFKKRREKALS